MRLYDKHSTYLVIGGMIFIHALVFALCTFFIYRFVIVTHDPSVYFLVSLLIGGVIICDVLAHPTQAVSRFFVRFKVDAVGILCYGIGWKSWKIEWDAICVYGIEGFSGSYGVPLMFLSTDVNEKFDCNRFALLTSQRIVFQVRDETWAEVSKYMPVRMREQLKNAIETSTDCYYGRQAKKKWL